MNKLLSLSRAARLAEVSRADLQRKIREGAIVTFEGKISVTDLLRVYPEVDVDRDAILERVERIKSHARPRSSYTDTELPSAEILMSRLNTFRSELVRHNAALNAREALLDEVEVKLRELSGLDSTELKAGVAGLAQWLDAARGEAVEEPDRRAQLLAKDAFLRIVAANVRLIPTGHEFFVEGAESILDASIRAGLNLSYGCSSGNCGSCKARIVKGEVAKIRDHDYVLSEREEQMGYVLACSNTAVTDLLLEAEEVLSVRELPPQEIRASVRDFKALSNGVGLLTLQTPRTQTLRYMAGQRAVLTLEDGVSTEQPIASCPCNGRNLQFVIRRATGDLFAGALWETGGPRVVVVNGPLGGFVLEENASDPAIFVAFEDGFAAVKSLIEHAVSIDNIESFHLYWSVAESGGHYMDRLCRSWRDSLDDFRYSPLVGISADAMFAELLRDHPDLAEYRFYLAGPGSAVNPVASGLGRHGVPQEKIRSELLD